ncbi:heat-inducible transcriptional repressor HrcA [Liquorilactobacillus sicerae]|uniref:heat-inducible transcriptional repressor HrcA n=1 Tax=Liquorilactobacillus sicerae TaxID=1416943 RepID=UPI0024807449|nr:heat-inducible transcriptional repressor HrcA [Liquorilactobacillus sicerae]
MLTERQLLILETIVQDYADAGHPVGSKALESQLPVHVSSATIRNEMATLEKMGFLLKEHSSSGRIPSLKGYRYYVDNLVKPSAIDPQLVDNVRKSLDNQFFKIDQLVATSAKILSQMTNYTAIAFKPAAKQVRLQGFRIMPMGNQQAMVMLITSDGEVESQLFNLPRQISGEELEAVVRIINDQIVGLPLDEVVSKLRESVPVLVHYIRQPSGFLSIFGGILNKAVDDQFYVGGKLNLLDFVEDGNIEQIKALYSLIDRSADITNLVATQDHQQAIHVKLGNEMADRSLLNYSLISTTYDVAQHGQGLIAILGPTNMPYSKIIALLEVFRDELAHRMLDYYDFYD